MPEIIPWHSDVVQRPVKFVRASGVFVAGINGLAQYDEADISYASVSRDDGQGSWQKVATLTDSFPVTRIWGGAYGLVGGDPEMGIPAVPTFVLCGDAFDRLGTAGTPNGPQRLQQLIWTSTTGNEWTQSKRGPAGTLYLMAWDENSKTFYAEGFNNVDDTYDVYQSIDGLAWSKIDSLPPSAPAHPLMEATGTPLIVDGHGHVVPYGGIFGWDRGGDRWITPQNIDSAYNSGRESDPNVVEVIYKEIDPETGAETIIRTSAAVPMKNVLSVANSGSVWHVGGYQDALPDAPHSDDYTSVIAVSTDAGATWQEVYGNPHESVTCVLAGEPAPNP